MAIHIVCLVLTLLCYASQSRVAVVRHAKLELRLAELQPADGLKEAKVEKTNEKIYLHKEAIITQTDLVEARAVPGYGSSFDISIVFSKGGAERLAKASQEHIGKPMAILIDGKVVSAPLLRSAISDQAQISGSFTQEEADKLVSRLTGK